MQPILSITTLVVLCVMIVDAQIPIPRREVGFVYNNGQANASVHLDVYIDLICPDSKAALPTMVKVAESYGPQVLRLTIHLFPLPYHRNGFYAAKGAHVMKALKKTQDSNLVYYWFNMIYSEIEDFTNTATHDMSDTQIVKKLAGLSNKLMPGSSQIFQDMIDSDTVEQDTRTAWKYACTRGVAATPTFMVNDIAVGRPGEATWTVDDWRKVIDPLLNI